MVAIAEEARFEIDAGEGWHSHSSRSCFVVVDVIDGAAMKSWQNRKRGTVAWELEQVGEAP